MTTITSTLRLSVVSRRHDDEIKRSEFLKVWNSMLEGFTEAEKSMILCIDGVRMSVKGAFNESFPEDTVGRRYWNNAMFWYLVGGPLPTYAKNGVYYPSDLAEVTGYEFVKGEGWEKVTISQAGALVTGDVLLVQPRKPPFGLGWKPWKELRSQLDDRGVNIVTMSKLFTDAIVEGDPITGVQELEAFIQNLNPKVVKKGTETWNTLPIGRFGELQFRYDANADSLEIMEGTEVYKLREHYSISGIPLTSKYLVFALVVNYLATSKSLRTMQGRRAYLAETFVDAPTIGVEHPLLTMAKHHKNGNLVVTASKSGIVPLITKGNARHNLEAAKAYHQLGYPTFLNKAAKWLLVGKGAQAVGVALDEQGLVHYMTNVDKLSKLLGRYLHGVSTGIVSNQAQSGIGIKIDDQVHHWYGDKIPVCRCQSPLVEEGSGNAPVHPDLQPLREQQKVVRTSIPGTLRGPIGIDTLVVLPKVGDVIAPGERVIGMRSLELINVNGKPSLRPSSVVSTIESNDSSLPGVIHKITKKVNTRSNTMDIKVVLLQQSATSAQKYRGTGKYRGLPYHRNVTVYAGDKVIFDPTKPLKHNQAHHLVGDEEGKTKTQLIEMAANAIGGAVWNGTRWENEAELREWVAQNRLEVVVERKDIEPTVYSMLKKKYGKDKSFTFDDQTRSAKHKAQAWVGEVVEVIETPFTETFLGKGTLFGEVLGYLAIDYPNLYNLIIEETRKNQKGLAHLYQMAEDLEEMGNEGALNNAAPDPYILVNSQFGTVVTFGPEFDIEVEVMPPDMAALVTGIPPEEYVANIQKNGYTSAAFKVSKITLPANKELDLETLRTLQKSLKKWNMKWKHHGIQFKGFNLWATNGTDYKRLHVYPSVIARVSGTVSQKLAQSFLRILMLLGAADASSNEKLKAIRQEGGWESQAYRSVALLQGSLESLVSESSTIMAKAARSGDIAFTARVATTIDGSVGLNECVLHPETAKYLGGLIAGDYCLPGRNPMPKMGALTLKLDKRVPKAVFLLNAFTWHTINEGDSDGDSTFWLAVSAEGELLKPTLNGTRKPIGGSKQILAEVKAKVGASKCIGYWQARGFLTSSLDPEVLLELPYMDFHENNSSIESKKNLVVKADAISMAPKDSYELEAFYLGTIMTQETCISNGFFLYSASEMKMHILLATYSRELMCPPTMAAVRYQAMVKERADILKDLMLRNAAMEICARMLYEGAGSLGGYKPEVWNLWGRLNGVGCPTDANILTDEDAIEYAKAYKKASSEDRRMLFSHWFEMAYGSEFKSKTPEFALVLPEIVNMIWEYYEMIGLYKAYERGDWDPAIFSDAGVSNNIKTLHLEALLSGMYRRINKGITEGATLDYVDAQHLTSSIYYMDTETAAMPVLAATKQVFRDYSGRMTSFGQWLAGAIDVSNMRIELLLRINERGKDVQTENHSLANGLAVSVSKYRKIDGK